MANPAQFGSFVPTTNIWDVTQISSLNIPPDLKELLIRMYQNLNLMSLVLNTKDSGFYDLQEFVTGQVFFPPTNSGSQTNPYVAPAYRQSYRKLINFGVLPNAGTKSVPHGIIVTSGTIWTRIYAAATDPVGLNGIPIPYASPTANNNIEINVDATNINITTGIDQTAFTICYVIVEYLKF